MSEKKKFPAQLLIFAFSCVVGILLTVGVLAAMAALMVSRGFSGTAAAPLATISVGAGSFCSGWLTAFRKQKYGLFCGALQGGAFAVLIALPALSSGILMDNCVLLRIAVVALSGCLGGFLGVRWPNKRRSV